MVASPIMVVKSYRDLEVWQRSFDAGMAAFELSKRFPREEMFSLSDQIRRSSRAVSAGICEAWETRRYEALFISKLTLAAGEAAETQNWLDYGVGCGYVSAEQAENLRSAYDGILRTIHSMILNSGKWCPNKSAIKDRSSIIIS